MLYFFFGDNQVEQIYQESSYVCKMIYQIRLLFITQSDWSGIFDPLRQIPCRYTKGSDIEFVGADRESCFDQIDL